MSFASRISWLTNNYKYFIQDEELLLWLRYYCLTSQTAVSSSSTMLSFLLPRTLCHSPRSPVWPLALWGNFTTGVEQASRRSYKKKTAQITSFGNGNQKLNFRLKTHFAFWLF